MAVVKSMFLKDAGGSEVEYDIGANAVNIDYQDGSTATNVKAKVDQLSADLDSISGHPSAAINTQTGAHNLRYYNNKLSYTTNGTDWVDISTGGGGQTTIVEAVDVIGASIKLEESSTYPDQIAYITWGDSDDSRWKGTYLLRKTSGIPAAYNDPDAVQVKVITSVSEKNNYILTPVESRSLTNNTVYYFRFFTAIDTDANGEADEYPGGICFKVEPKASIQSGDMFKSVYDPDNDGIIGIAQGGTGNTEGYVRAGQLSGSTIGVMATAEGLNTIASGKQSHAEGNGAVASGNSSHAEGYDTTAAGAEGHAEGIRTLAYGTMSHAEGNGSYAQGKQSHAEGESAVSYGDISHAEGQSTSARGLGSHSEGQFTSAQHKACHAEGEITLALGQTSHAEGYHTTAGQYFDADYGDHKGTHAEGYETYAVNRAAHAEGSSTTAYGDSSHAEGTNTLAYGTSSHAEGNSTSAYNTSHAEGTNTYAYNNSHAEGNNTYATTSSHAEGNNTYAYNISHAEGQYTTAYGYGAHAEGANTYVVGDYSHTEGNNTYTAGDYSHAEGSYTTANGKCSHTEGYSTFASNYQHVQGHYNTQLTGGSSSGESGVAFIIGNGISSTTKNAFNVKYSGQVNFLSSGNTPNQDYAEFFEQKDNNEENEDRVGYFVTFDEGRKIKIASIEDEYILGITSGAPSVVGNSDCDTWNGMIIRDEFNRIQYEPNPKYEINKETGKLEPVVDEQGNPVYEGIKSIINPEYDPSQLYISRWDRPEQIPVGMLGMLPVRDDGTCEVNGYCTVAEGGIATKATNDSIHKYRVIGRKTENVIEIVFK